jgi:hypothetical protein
LNDAAQPGLGTHVAPQLPTGPLSPGGTPAATPQGPGQ